MTSRQGERRVGPYTIAHSQPLYENPSIKLREDSVRDARGEPATFTVITIKPRVTVLPLDDDRRVHLLQEFKYAAGQPSLEAVNGSLEAGENPEQAALRAIGEHVGLIASEWIDMGLVHPLTNIVNSPNHIFLARKLSKINRSPDPRDQIEIVNMPFPEALQAVLDGTITHAATCTLILKTHLFLDRTP